MTGPAPAGATDASRYSLDASRYSLFEHEEEVIRRADGMVAMLEEVAAGVRALAEAYRAGLAEQRRLVRFSDRMQAELQDANQRLSSQADELLRLNESLTQEIETRRKLEEELRRFAITDGLTGGFNRRHFLYLAERDARRCLRNGHAISLLLMDLDRFKSINDTFGHAAGDDVLVAFAALCRSRLRDLDIFGRIGGEEFAVVLPEVDMHQALEIAARLRTACAASEVVHRDRRLAITVSVGVAPVLETDDPVEDAMSRADRALYRAKSRGRNRVEPWDGTDPDDAEAREDGVLASPGAGRPEITVTTPTAPVRTTRGERASDDRDPA